MPIIIKKTHDLSCILKMIDQSGDMNSIALFKVTINNHQYKVYVYDPIPMPDKRHKIPNQLFKQLVKDKLIIMDKKECGIQEGIYYYSYKITLKGKHYVSIMDRYPNYTLEQIKQKVIRNNERNRTSFNKFKNRSIRFHRANELRRLEAAAI